MRTLEEPDLPASPIKLFLIVAAVVLVCETSIMLPLNLAANRTADPVAFALGILDPLLLLCMLVPVLYYAQFRPLMRLARQALNLRDEIRTANEGLEARVRERTRELEEKTRQLHSIADVLSALLATKDVHHASRCLLRAALELSGGSHGFVGVTAPGPTLRILAREGFQQMAASGDVVEPIGLDTLFGRAVITRDPVVSNEVLRDSGPLACPTGSSQLETFMGVPILQATEVLGEIGVANRPGGFTSTEVQKLTMLAQMASPFFVSYRRQEKQALLEEELRQAQKMEAVGQLAGGIAHDFNNALMPIGGYAELLEISIAGDDPESRDYVEEIRRAVARASDLIGQLLVFSRRQAIRPRVLCLTEVVAGLESMLRRFIEETIDLVVVPGANIGMIEADSTLMEQVIVNLVVNARDAMPTGGTLTIATRAAAPAEVEAAGFAAGVTDCVVLDVSDTGVGIPCEIKERMFEPFFTSKPVGKGTGLGLSTVSRIVQDHGGRILVDTTVGEGTTFHIFFPRTSKVPDLSPPPARWRSSRRSRRLCPTWCSPT
ncbi:MAG: GAF domain-containing protein [Candidatus Riflebacteria bacterium]|nr:GAF domain-containing protein [Candidatus Riflebacteria bacterium]